MQIIPIFPLHTVLFPGMPLHLHIFEDRYKLMIQQCMDQQSEFGVAMIQEGREALGPVATPYDLGCTARIVQAERLPGGRMNIKTIGQHRFRLDSIQSAAPYLSAAVRIVDLPDDANAPTLARELEPLLREYLNLLSVRAGAALERATLPEAPEQFIYACAYLLQAPQIQKQEFLEASTLSELSACIRQHYRKQIDLLHILQSRHAQAPQTPEGFHLN
ncbi:MAG: LON peptidase substrate-binding domain-containing protein [Leptospirales bacterium]|nr:LON peptidase substrate-binding domain-containing protein [Leptospirales bacterium]